MIAGDGRHDSMGHSAKYGAYTVFSCDINMILDFALLQVNIRSILYNYHVNYVGNFS